MGTATMARVTDPSEPIRLLIVDDDPMVRAGLVSMLGGTPDLLIVGEAADGAAAIAAVDEHRPDVVLMDIAMRTMNGLEATEALRERAGAPEIIILTTFGSDEHLLRALRAGAAGFLLKDAAPPQIVDAVRRVASGEPMLSGKVTRQLIDYVSGPGPHSAGAEARTALSGLTDRERDVARCDRRRQDERGDRGRTVHERAHGENPHQQAADQTRPEQPGPDRAAHARRGNPLTSQTKVVAAHRPTTRTGSTSHDVPPPRSSRTIDW